MLTKKDRREGETLTKGIRVALERQARIGGGISRNQYLLLITHIERLEELLEEALNEGPEWGDEEWSVFTDAAIPLIDGWTIRTSAKLSKLR